MADEEASVVASAVVVPTPEILPESPSVPAKRRQSSASQEANKRARLDGEEGASLTEESPTTQHRPLDDTHTDATPNGQLRASKSIDERKRGRRLFGALLGTLAQNSPSTAHKRRVDIERKQQEKLKLQSEEFDEQRKARLDELMIARRQQQEKFEKESTMIRHSNLLATANFLQTETEPKLYYRPWELTSAEKDRIESQIKDAEALVKKEKPDADGGNEATSENTAEQSGEAEAQAETIAAEEESKDQETMLSKERPDTEVNGSEINETNRAVEIVPDHQPNDPDMSTSKDAIDDVGDDMVEGEEDTVIY